MGEVKKTYNSSTAVRTPKELAQEVRKALGANEQQGEFTYETEEKRKILREETAHHLPVSHRPVKVVGLLGKDDDNEYNRSAVAIKHYGSTPSEELASSTAPLQDKRFLQELSEEDKKIANKNRKRLSGV